MKKIFFMFFVFIFIASICFAHSGRTDSYGGHYNRSEGTYHYHSGQYAGTGDYTAPIEEGGTKITEDGAKETRTEVVVKTDDSDYIKNLESKIKTLEQQVETKQESISKLNDEIKEKNEKIMELEDKTSEYIAFGFILVLTIYISYNIGKNKE